MARKPQEKTKQSQPKPMGDIFEHFAEHNPGYDAGEPSQRQTEGRQPTSLDALMARIDGLERQNAELGIFLQDAWTIKRVTLKACVFCGSGLGRNPAYAVAAKALGKERWAGVVDSVGSNTLANAISQTRYGGAVAA